MIPIFLVRSKGTARGIKTPVLPSIMGESLVCLGHPMYIVFLLYSRARTVGAVQQLCGQLLRHRMARPGLGGSKNPSHGQGETAVTLDLHRNLIGGATDPAGLDL